jgi:hypothetical protein
MAIIFDFHFNCNFGTNINKGTKGIKGSISNKPGTPYRQRYYFRYRYNAKKNKLEEFFGVCGNFTSRNRQERASYSLYVVCYLQIDSCQNYIKAFQLI